MKHYSKNDIAKYWIYFSVGLIFTLFMSYQLAFKQTINLSIQYLQNSKMTLEIQSTNISPSNNNINQTKLLRQYIADTTIIRENLLDSINSLCNNYNCTITNFPNSFLINEYNHQIINNTLDLEGNYYNLLKIMHEIELNNFYGKINAFNFYVVNDLRTKKRSLHLQLYLQHLISM